MSQEAGKMSEELNAQIAINLYGGKWLRYKDPNYEDPDSYDFKVHAFLVLPDKHEYFLHDASYVEDTGECVRDNYSWIPNYSSDMNEAMDVLHQMRLRGYYVEITAQSGYNWSVKLERSNLIQDSQKFYGDAATLPVAICQAALAAVKGEKQ